MPQSSARRYGLVILSDLNDEDFVPKKLWFGNQVLHNIDVVKVAS